MSKILTVVGIILLVLGGLVTVILGLLVPVLIDSEIQKSLEDALVLENEDYDEPWSFDSLMNAQKTTMGDEWLYNGPENTKAAPTYDSFYLYNITNYNPTTNTFEEPTTGYGNKPYYVEVGPYVCRRIENKSLIDDPNGRDDTLSYKSATWYLENATGHGTGVTKDSKIISWNPAYWGYVAQAGGEMYLYFGVGQMVLDDGLQLNATTDFGGNLTKAEEAWGVTVCSNLTYTQIHQILYNTTYGIAANSTGVGSFYTFYKQANVTMFGYIYGISLAQGLTVGYYLENTVLRQEVPGYMYLNGFGYITVRTLHEWLFSYFDPLAELPAGLLDNDTSYGDGFKRFNRGSDDLDKIWDEETEWGFEVFELGATGADGITGPGYWLDKEEVAGTDATHFAPDVGKGDDLVVWNSDTVRQLIFEYLEDTEVRRINTLRFHLSPDAFKKDANYHQLIEGYANMTAWKSGVPIYLCTPHYQIYQDCENVPEEYDIIVDVEPNTGDVLNEYKRLQFNLKLFNFSFYHTTVNGTYWFTGDQSTAQYIEPMGWLERWGSADNLPQEEFDDAKDSLNKLESEKDLSGLLTILGLGSGLVLFAAGAAMVIIPKFADEIPGE